MSGAAGGGAGAAAGGAFPQAFQGLTKEAAEGPADVVSGFSRPAATAASQLQLPQPQKITPGAAAAAAAAAPSGNMNMSIRYVLTQGGNGAQSVLVEVSAVASGVQTQCKLLWAHTSALYTGPYASTKSQNMTKKRM